jgi:adenosylcobinamide kinase / adenosylcobinamide-phosphate guanylyltransferase
MSLIFITGGARSGKSSFALEAAKGFAPPYTFLATAQGLDEEMQSRIAQHQLERQGLGWQTREAPLEPEAVLGELEGTVLLDCLSLWVSNLLLADLPENAMLEKVEHLLTAQAQRGGDLLVVSNEVGSGIVPAYPLGRSYRDWLGRANQRVARAADTAHLLVAGLGLRLK